MNPKLEYRQFHELRQDADAGGFAGYASHFMSADSYLTAVKRGAYRKTLKERGDKIPVLYSHNPEWNIGVPEVMREDKAGLYVETRLFDDGAEGSTTLRRLRQGARFGLSVGFQTIKDRSATEDDELDLSQVNAKTKDIRIIEEIRLWEYSVVSFPANEAAVISDVRAQAEADALASLIEHIRAGTLQDEHAALVAELVAAFSEREQPEPEPSTPLPDESARHTHDLRIALALANARGLIGAHA